MGLIRSILLLAGVTCSVGFAYFFGHALSTHHMKPVYIGTGLLVIGIILLAIFTRMGRNETAHESGH